MYLGVEVEDVDCCVGVVEVKREGFGVELVVYC